MEDYIGIIKLFAGNFAPRSWAYCDGQLLSISQNTALFSILGTTYGGDGRTTFGLPDLRGRVPMGIRTGNGLTPRTLGQQVGQQSTALITNNLPAHNHAATVSDITATAEATVTIPASSDAGSTSEPGGSAVLAVAENATNSQAVNIYNTEVADSNLKPFTAPVAITATGGNVTVGLTGNSVPFNNMQPTLGLNYIICMQGLFPPRS